jgi:hypothetical protein
LLGGAHRSVDAAALSPAAVAAAPLSVGGLIAAAGVLVVMYIVLGIALWVSILGAFAALATWALAQRAASRSEKAMGSSGTPPAPGQPVDSPVPASRHAAPNGDSDASRRRDPVAA